MLSAASWPSAPTSDEPGAVGIRPEPAAATLRRSRRANPPGAGARVDVAVAAAVVIGVEFFVNGGGSRQAAVSGSAKIANCRVVGERLKSTLYGHLPRRTAGRKRAGA